MSERAGSGWDCSCRANPPIGECAICSEFYVVIARKKRQDPDYFKKLMARVSQDMDRYKRTMDVVNRKNYD